ncbi:MULTISPECIES: hypothetical protein [unclassified Paraburkholderia]|uniref:hypothetical protein n=1 Tax=unclassified Paraburkholderia TaxID=2615204 RepID=UPI00160DDE46|nr:MULTISPECIES: hypothetical protein [unclassified Paraburkholderia]MBB5448374.1 hypothetical protein [Paraburkholderia sp. WSM4177]MBB5488755.1 hypothetical protein [Paraburkholderia sp. WSM4180]
MGYSTSINALKRKLKFVFTFRFIGQPLAIKAKHERQSSDLVEAAVVPLKEKLAVICKVKVEDGFSFR